MADILPRHGPTVPMLRTFEGMLRRSNDPRRRAKQRGAVLVEYTMLVTLVALPTVAGITWGAMDLVRSYAQQNARILSPRP